VRSIEWDLQDLDETVGIVEANPKKFDLSTEEVASRKAFITQTRATMSEIKSALTSTDAQTKQDADQRKVCPRVDCAL
jgi:syntaxin 6